MGKKLGKVAAIGDSRGVRLPKTVLQKYRFGELVILEERPDGALLKSANDKRLSWTDTYAEMSSEQDAWSVFDDALDDGLQSLAW
jgi:antitoxin MazE